MELKESRFVHLSPEEEDAVGYTSPVDIDLIDLFEVQSRLEQRRFSILERETSADHDLQHQEHAEILNDKLKLADHHRIAKELAELVAPHVVEVSMNDYDNS